MKRKRPNAMAKIRRLQRDPTRRKPLKPTALYSPDPRQLSFSVIPGPRLRAASHPPALPDDPGEQFDLEDYIATRLPPRRDTTQ